MPNFGSLSPSNKPQRPTNRLKKPPTNISSDPEPFRLPLFRNTNSRTNSGCRTNLPEPLPTTLRPTLSLRHSDPERIQRRYTTVTHSSPATIGQSWENQHERCPDGTLMDIADLSAGPRPSLARSLSTRPRPKSTVISRRQSLDAGLPTRRRSLLFAAPPATATRSLNRDNRVSMPQLRGVHPEHVQTFEDKVDDKRCMTPSGISVLGPFKRGSLHITNGATSPEPSSAPPSPTKNTFDLGIRMHDDTLSAINDTASRTLPPPLDIPPSKFPSRTSSKRWRRHAYSKSYEAPSPLILSPFSFQYSEHPVSPKSGAVSPEDPPPSPKTAPSSKPTRPSPSRDQTKSRSKKDLHQDKTKSHEKPMSMELFDGLPTGTGNESDVHLLAESVVTASQVTSWNDTTAKPIDNIALKNGKEFTNPTPRYGYGLSGTRSIVVKELQTATTTATTLSAMTAAEYKTASQSRCGTVVGTDISMDIHSNFPLQSKITGQEYYQRFSRRRSQLIEGI